MAANKNIFFLDHCLEDALKFYQANFGDIKIAKIMEKVNPSHPAKLLLNFKNPNPFRVN